jgi:hypothetical protein
MKQPIPDAALDDRLGFVGTAGSGKSYNAMGRVEQIAEGSGYSAGSGNFNNLLGGLRSLCVIDYPRAGEAEITAWAKEIL